MRPLLLALLALAAPFARAEEGAPTEPTVAGDPVAADAAPTAPETAAAAAPAPEASPEEAQPAPATAEAPPPAGRIYTGEPPLPPPPIPPSVALPPASAGLVPSVVAAPRGGSRRFGLMIEAGLPQGVTASLTYRPLGFVRLWAGPSWDYAGFGVQGGVMLVPFWSIVAPTLSLEAGRFFDADVTPIADRFGEVPVEISPLLKNVRLEYVAAHVGLEFGSRHFAISLRAGLARMRVIARGRAVADDFFVVDPTLVAAVPTLKLGIQTTF